MTLGTIGVLDPLAAPASVTDPGGIPAWPIALAACGLALSLALGAFFWARSRRRGASDARVRHLLEARLGIGRPASALLNEIVAIQTGEGRDRDALAVQALMSGDRLQRFVVGAVERGAVRPDDPRFSGLYRSLGIRADAPGTPARGVKGVDQPRGVSGGKPGARTSSRVDALA